ncbi:MFS transporter [Halalkalibacter urbisdiaboli]|uniref:MFS transporter n=1 Tax=Halalkalibacter urbisdiaboli TaxID=1960589 RepID=UPI000B441894|nr:MFS transporter [Halalkalibacter urbisdiaboli]
MTKALQIFMEYKVIEQKINEYEQAMERVLTELPEFGATNIQWFVSEEQPFLYVEMYEVPTFAHYHALKKLRRSEEHHIFGEIAAYIDGGIEKIHCWAFQRKE